MPGLRAVPGWIGRAHARTPLRVRLVGAVLLLVIAALVGSGAAAAATMRSYLVGRVDDQIRSFAEHAGRGGGPDDRGNDADSDRSRLPSDFVVEETNAKGAFRYPAQSNLLNSDPLPKFPHLTAAQSTAAGEHMLTVGAVSGHAKWRVYAAPITLPDGSTGTLLVAQSLSGVQDTVNQLTVLLLIIGAAALVVVAGAGYVVVRASLRPLRDVERTAAKIAAGDLSQRVPRADPRTEVGQLAGALNTMLSEIETAFAERAASEQRMRRFVADASHELRTPLTSIRGFAELYRQGAAADPADVRRLMGRIEDEAKRMGLLVEDLLLLARLDQERPLAQVPVDMLALAGDAVHDAQAVDPQRPITLEVGATEPPPVVIGDESRLRQVLGNLLTNALRHTPAGTPVRVTVGVGRGERIGRPAVLLSVADQGPGMTPDEAARVFERFYRADRARGRTEGSTGLGLAIVAALVAGHGGAVDVETAPGAGACFRVELPLADAAQR